MEGWVLIAVVAIAGGIGAGIVEEILKWRLKVLQLRETQKRREAEERLKSDELNAKLLRMDDVNLSAAEISSLAQEVRQLRQEVAELRQEIHGRVGQS